MAKIDATCSKCAATFRVGESNIGEEVVCGSCGAPFVIPEPGADGDPDTQWLSLVAEVEAEHKGTRELDRTVGASVEAALLEAAGASSAQVSEAIPDAVAPGGARGATPTAAATTMGYSWRPASFPGANLLEMTVKLGAALLFVTVAGQLVVQIVRSPDLWPAFGVWALLLLFICGFVVPANMAVLKLAGRMLSFALPARIYVRMFAVLAPALCCWRILDLLIGGANATAVGVLLGCLLAFFIMWLLFNLGVFDLIVSYVCCALLTMASLILLVVILSGAGLVDDTTDAPVVRTAPPASAVSGSGV